MKQIWAALALLLALSAAAAAEPVSGFGMTFESTAQAIDFGAKDIGDAGALCDFLAQFPALEQADMYGAALTRGQMAQLSERFPQVRFGWTLHFGDHTLRTDATAFSTLHSKNSRFHTSQDFDVLRYCWNLKALDLGHNAITDVSFLEGLTELRLLILGRNQVEDISALKNLTKLEYAELFSNKIRDISALGGLTQLKDLNLVNNPIADFTPIYGIDGMERLWCGMNSRVTREVKNALRAELPGCRIDSESHPTGGGWRDHPHYDVIYEVFGTGVYKPFE